MTAALDRKDFLRVVAVSGAGLSLSLQLVPGAAAAAGPVPPAATAASFVPVAWVEMGLDGLTTVVVNQTELGQGIATALPMCVAEELDIPMSSVRFRISPAEVKYYNAQWHGIATGGSKSTPSMSPVMRQAGATARAMLVTAAAIQVERRSCRLHHVERRRVPVRPGQKAKYVELADAAAADSCRVPANVPLKTPDKFKIIGTRQARLDVKPKTNGTAVYGMDVKVPGMKYASIEKPLQIGGKESRRSTRSAALKVPSVRQVIQVPSGIAVIADNTWAAFQEPQGAARDVGSGTQRRSHDRVDVRAHAHALENARGRAEEHRRCGGGAQRHRRDRELRNAVPRARADGADEHHRRRASR